MRIRVHNQQRGKNVKITVTATVDIDADQWASEYDVNRDEVCADVQDYYRRIVEDFADTFNETGCHQIPAG